MSLSRRSAVRAAAVVGVAGVVAIGGPAVSQAVDAPPPSPASSNSAGSDAAEAERETAEAEQEAAEAEREAAEAEQEAAAEQETAEEGEAAAEDEAASEAGRAEREAAKAERKAAQAQRKAEREAAKAQRRAARATGGGPGAAPDQGAQPAPPVDFVCDPSKNHGQNVSAYARSLPSGPGRGRQVSAAARSDCGKPSR